MFTARTRVDLRLESVLVCLRLWVGWTHITLCSHPVWDRKRYTGLRCQGWDLLKGGNPSLETIGVLSLRVGH